MGLALSNNEKKKGTVRGGVGYMRLYVFVCDLFFHFLILIPFIKHSLSFLFFSIIFGCFDFPFEY